MRKLQTGLAVTMIVLCAGLVAADEIVLEDGSVIVGVVQELKGKRLRVRTKTMGVVRIQRDTIVEIRMERPLTVEFESGERFTGIVAVQDELATITGEAEARTVAASEIRMMEKPQPGVWGRLDVTASGGINVVRGNTLTTSYRVDAGGTFHHDNGRTRGSIATTVNEREGKEDAQRSTFDLAHEYWGLGRFTLDGILNLETNESSDLDLRSIVALATGYKLLRGPVHRLEPIVGMAWVSEDFVGIPVEEGFEGVVGFAYRLRVGPTRFDSDLAVFPFNSDRTLVNYDAKLRFELIYNLDLDITYYDRYNSDPPVAALTRDYGLTIGLGWSN